MVAPSDDFHYTPEGVPRSRTRNRSRLTKQLSCLTEKQTELADATLRSHRSRLRHFREWCNEQDITNPNSLSGRDIHRYRLWRREDGSLSPASEKTQMDTIRVFIRFCESIDAVQTDLSTKVVSPSLDAGDNVRDVMIELETAEEILEYLRTYEYASERHVCFRLMWRAALRRGAVRALDVDDYDQGDQPLHVKYREETGTSIKTRRAVSGSSRSRMRRVRCWMRGWMTAGQR